MTPANPVIAPGGLEDGCAVRSEASGQARADLACSATFENAAGSRTARSASTLRSSVDAGFREPIDEPRVGSAVHPCRGVDAGDPQPAEVALLVAAVLPRVAQGVHHRLVARSCSCDGACRSGPPRAAGSSCVARGRRRGSGFAASRGPSGVRGRVPRAASETMVGGLCA